MNNLRNLKNEIINGNGVCTIKTETTFSDCVVGDGIIIAISKERKQLIKYTSDLEIISVETIEYVSMREYRFKKLIFLVFEIEINSDIVSSKYKVVIFKFGFISL